MLLNLFNLLQQMEFVQLNFLYCLKMTIIGYVIIIIFYLTTQQLLYEALWSYIICGVNVFTSKSNT